MKILIVDDHPAMRFAISALLGTSKEMELVGEADNAGEALRQAQETSPDLAIVDLQLKGDQNGIELCREMKSLPEPPKVLVYTAHNTREHAQSALLSGADGFLHKGQDCKELLEAVQCTYNGKRPWLLGVEEEVESQLQTISDPSLTDRENEVYALVLRRYTNLEIAQELYIQLPTVKSHVSNILRKLDRKSRKDLIS